MLLSNHIREKEEVRIFFFASLAHQINDIQKITNTHYYTRRDWKRLENEGMTIVGDPS